MAAARMSVLCAAAVGITTLLLFSHVGCKANFVQINLNAKWNSTPLFLEASEFLSKENEDYFWGFVEAITQRDPESLKEESDESLYHLLLELAANYLSTLQVDMLKLSLSLRVHSPEVEMHDQMAKEDKLAMSSGEEKWTNCEAFVNVHGVMTCDVKEIDSLIESASTRSKAPTYTFDHRFPNSAQNDVLVILYARLGTAASQTFHQRLRQLTMNKEIDYVFRHYIPNPANQQVRLSGYGVELAIKSTEYKAKDDTKVEGEKTQSSDEEEHWEKEIQGFDFHKLKELHPELKPQLRELHNYLMDTATELTPLKVWQLQDLSLQAATKALSAPPEEALNVLQTISQNFPVQARSLVRTIVPEDIRKEIVRNQKHFENYQNLSPGECAIYLNGIPIDIEVYDVYTLLDTMKSEAAVMEGLFSLGVKNESLNKLVKMDLKNNVEDYVLDFRHSAVEYINDLEKDAKYKRWPTSIQEMLRPTFPGMLRHIAKNIFHMVFVLDPAHPQSKDLLKIAEAFYVHSAPVRIGIVFAVNATKELDGRADPGVAVARTFQYIKGDQDPASALSFITDLYEKGKTEEMTSDFIINEFSSRFNDEDIEKLFGDDDDYDDLRKLAADFVKKSGLSDFPQVLLNGVPLKKKYLNADMLEEAVVSEILHGTHEIQRAVYHGELTDNMNMLDWLMEKENVLPRMNSRILSAPLMYLDLTENADKEIYSDPETFSALSVKGMSSVIAQNMHYLARKDDSSLRAVSIWIVADVESPKGRELVYTAIKNLRFSSHMRVGIIFNPPHLDQDNFISRAVYVAMATLTGNMAKNFVTKLVKEENVKGLKNGTKTLKDLEVNGMDIDQYLATLDKEDGTFLKPHRAFVIRVLQLEPGAQTVIGNGKVIGQLGPGEQFIQEDFSLLEKHLMQTAAKKIQAHVETMSVQGQSASDLVMKISSLLSAKSLSKSRKEINYHSDTHSVVKIPSDPEGPSFEMEIIMDPASREAQKLVPILITLKEVANINIKIFMNSKDKLSELPLTNFYRYVLEPDLKFNADGSASPGPMARFENLPQKSLLTLNMHPPESWLVESVKSPYDLDNIMLEEVKNGVSADFELEYLLLEGHCHDSSSGQPPRGLQFTLGTNSTPVLVDTIVMANLGYFQLKAYPGVWLLRLREGRSREIYEILSHEMTDTPANSKDVIVAIGSFKSTTIRIKVGKKSDKLPEELLKDDEDDEDESMGIWDSISSSFGGGKKEKKEDKDSTLNIFSLASGHLYERFLRIMMLSVLKNTKSKVKFWFLKNYLSPTFKDFIPYMAQEYGFEYELVQYKWPRWLNQQKEKQRIIWGYKILFLDVLFPLDVKKIIFVDADQNWLHGSKNVQNFLDNIKIVRTDLQELYDFDLGGAPYGYTPFCSSRTEMDGFRFWKSGYWASHLGGRKYHISALYVVDLKKFRRIAAGDRLRGQYQGLSQDPNSLANLDQDLPNNMIHQVAIKSLPQEWLWCETWCSTEELARAKTIDLCNNPLTKEPKLQAAIRIVPEWKDYDYEIKVLWDKIYGTNVRFQIEYEKPKKYRDEDDNAEEKKSKTKTEL